MIFLYIFSFITIWCFVHIQVKTHLHDMYTRPSTAEQCLHNALKVVNAMRYIGMDYDIQVGFMEWITYMWTQF